MKTRPNFIQTVEECISAGELTQRRVRRFSARARAYICTYHYLNTSESENKCEPLMVEDIERVMKEFRTHRSACDFDLGFLGSCREKKDLGET